MRAGVFFSLGLPAVFFAAAATLLMTQVTLAAAVPEECRAKPDFSAPSGGHWHYRVDRVNQRRCWFLSSGNSRMRQHSLLSRRELLSHGTEAKTGQQSELYGKTGAGPTLRQEVVVLPEEQTPRDLAATALATSEELVPHKVTSISYIQPRVAAPSSARGTNLNSISLCGALATALFVAAAAFQLVGRIRRRPRTASPQPTPLPVQVEEIEQQRAPIRKLRDDNHEWKVRGGPQHARTFPRRHLRNGLAHSISAPPYDDRTSEKHEVS